ncbi:uncharacterized protein AMSG_09932 [Thecamonas trahens ATCC 50062]|uniref:Uncharacterized protein n=1 Tax=Thecamonas trahens ATCC 50062 TaxID=461836 RepID=A0A0L0DRV1_THETB|nr:hypothetical protein AMSG_09932 [Thecamonas trahens ATCC 50062]KNC54153.1 hypothetical protein AMSG_09932 [Thecamonas trahens ATCC 50062]|eukprot:XP_013753974.1 hypothetical protein AMSG_09932 [Thecamonas trahens ATCC 50062]
MGDQVRITVIDGPPPGLQESQGEAGVASGRALLVDRDGSWSSVVVAVLARLGHPTAPEHVEATRLYTPQGGECDHPALIRLDDVLYVVDPLLDPPPTSAIVSPPASPARSSPPDSTPTATPRSPIRPLPPSENKPDASSPRKRVTPRSPKPRSPKPPPSGLSSPSLLSTPQRTPRIPPSAQIANRGHFSAASEGGGTSSRKQRRQSQRRSIRTASRVGERVISHWTAHLVCDPFCEAVLTTALGDRRGCYGSFLSTVDVASVPNKPTLRIRFKSSPSAHGSAGLYIRTLLKKEALPAVASSSSVTTQFKRANLSAASSSGLNATAHLDAGLASLAQARSPSSPHMPLDAASQRKADHTVRALVRRANTALVHLSGTHRGFVLFRGRIQTPEWEVWNAPIYFHGNFLAVEHKYRVPHTLAPTPPTAGNSHENGSGSNRIVRSRRAVRPSRMSLLRSSVATSSQPSDAPANPLSILRNELLAASRYGAHARTAEYAPTVPDRLLAKPAQGLAPPTVAESTLLQGEPVAASNENVSSNAGVHYTTMTKHKSLRESGAKDVVLSASQAEDVTLMYDPSPHRVTQIRVRAGRKLVIKTATLRPMTYAFQDHEHTVATSVYVAEDVLHLSGEHAFGPHGTDAEGDDSPWRLLCHHVWHDPQRERAGRGIPIPGTGKPKRRKKRRRPTPTYALAKDATSRLARRRKRNKNMSRKARAPVYETGTVRLSGDGTKTMTLNLTLPGPHTYTFYCCSGSLVLHGALVRLSVAEQKRLAIEDLHAKGMHQVLSLSRAVGEHLALYGYQASPELQPEIVDALTDGTSAKLGLSPRPPAGAGANAHMPWRHHPHPAATGDARPGAAGAHDGLTLSVNNSIMLDFQVTG